MTHETHVITHLKEFAFILLQSKNTPFLFLKILCLIECLDIKYFNKFRSSKNI